MSEIDRAELCRLLDEAELPWTIEHATPNMDGPNWQIRREGKPGIIVSAHEYGFYGRGEVIAAAVNALPGLLDALQKAEGHRDSLAAALIEVQREKLVLERAIERVRALHTCEARWGNEDYSIDADQMRPGQMRPGQIVARVTTYRVLPTPRPGRAGTEVAP